MLCVYQALKSIEILISTMLLNALAEICAPLSQQHYELHPIGLHRTGRSLIFWIITFYIWLLPRRLMLGNGILHNKKLEFDSFIRGVFKARIFSDQDIRRSYLE